MRTVIWFIYFWGYMLLHLPTLIRGQMALKKGDWYTADSIAAEHVPQWCGRLLDLAGVQVTVTGRENIPEGRPCVFVANHRSYYDIPLMLTSLDAPHALVSKIEVSKIPLVNRWMALLHCVFVNRGDARQSLRSMNEAVELIKKGYSVSIFPEGTRHTGEEGTLGEMHGGAFRIAQKGGAPIVPVCIFNSRACLEIDGHFTMKPAKVAIHILPPLETVGLSRAEVKELPEKAAALMRSELAAGPEGKA